MDAAGALREQAREVVGRYRLGKQLAVGGMGVIFEAHDTLLRRDVAYKRLKVAHEASRPRLTALFEREYNALRQLKHPNIVEVYDYGLDAEGPFYTMELLTGQDLAGAAPLPLAHACRVLRDVAAALALVHARRFVHRDVTPANVRLTPDGRAKLIDFGALSEFGVAREVVGTPAFIAPESLTSEELDGRVDLFALGAVAYWAVTRRVPYPVRSIYELSEAWTVPVPPPSEFNKELPRELDELVLSLLDVDRAARPPSAAHVMERVSALVELPREQDEAQAALSYLLHPPLVGRSASLGDLRMFLAAALEGSGRSVMIEGTSGLGRSALLDQLATEAQVAGSHVLRYAPSGKRESGLVHVIVQSMRATFPALWGEMRKAYPVLSQETLAVGRRDTVTNDAPERRGKLAAAAVACVQEMSLLSPLVLLVDDAHRIDAESLAVVASLARVTGESPLLLVATQEVGAATGDAGALGDLRAAAKVLSLKPLAESDLDQMVSTVFGNVPNGHHLSRFLHSKSGGNPGQCVDLCRLLMQRGEIRYELGRFALPFDPQGDVPGKQALVLTRLAGLSEQALRLLRLTCVAESSLTRTQAALALGTSEEELVLIAEQLSSRDLLRTDDETVSRASDSLQKAVRGELAPDLLTDLHLALSRAILAAGVYSLDDKFAACHHLLSAGREDEALDVVWDTLRESMPEVASAAVFAPVLERLLEVLRRRGHSDEHCWSLLSPLVAAGFWGEVAAVRRHQETALVALANMTGMSLARRLAPRLGKKLALLVGILAGIWHMIVTPKRFRPPSYAEGMQRLFSAATMATATNASAYDPKGALHAASFLDPIEAMKEGTAGRVAREFALATAEVAAGRWESSSPRYAAVKQQLEVRQLFDANLTRNLRAGCLNGRGQADVTMGARDVLDVADELALTDPFFAPHAESIRMSYHGYRGDKERADHHRKQGEILALQGGLSWSAFTMFSIRAAYIAMGTNDTMGVLAASADLERLSTVAPNALWYRDLCLAYVAMVRGRAAEALPIYERLAAEPSAQLRPTIDWDTSFYAEALVRLSLPQKAKAMCEEAVEQRKKQGATLYSIRGLLQQLALVEAALGNAARARELLEELLVAVVETGVPAAIGGVHRDLARIALLEKDTETFDRHFAATVQWYRDTKNPALLQQCRRLLAEAEKRGVAASPSWEKHQLAQPANTQDLASEAPDVTELIATVA